MKRKLVQAGASLAVTLPAEIVREFRLKKGGLGGCLRSPPDGCRDDTARGEVSAEALAIWLRQRSRHRERTP